MCGHGGIGRRVTLRSLWAKPVEVQVFLAAPFFPFFSSLGRCPVFFFKGTVGLFLVEEGESYA